MSFGTFNLADIAAQAQASRLREQQMQMQQRQMDFNERKFFADLDKEKREQVEAAVKDLSAAVQWADTPEKWAQVQQHYGQYDPQLASVTFDQRETSLVRLGQMGEYLNATAPKIMSIEAGGSLAAVDPRTGKPSFTVLPNPGDAAPGSPAQGGVQEGATATNLQTGQKLIFRGGQWQPMGGGAGNSVGGFQPGQ